MKKHKLGKLYRLLAVGLLVPMGFAYLFSFDKKLRDGINELWRITRKGEL